MQIKVPFLAEGVDSGVVVSILVKEGDSVKRDQTVLELETNKATAPIPSPADGTIQKILVKEGQEVTVGAAIMILTEGAAKGRAAEREEKVKTKGSTVEQSDESSAESEAYTYQSKSGLPPPASPEVRKMARELGIDLTKIKGSERGGRITAKDVKTYIVRLKSGAQIGQKTLPAGRQAQPVVVDFSKWGPIKRKPVSHIRRVIGQKMLESWTHIPQVTQFDEADISKLLELRKKYAPLYEKEKVKLTVTGVVLKVVLKLLKKYPIFNSSLDEVKNEIVLKQYYHFGIAVDTEQGLMVPVLKDCDKKDLLQISVELAELSEKARQKKISLEEVQGATFTISNLGSIGGSHFTPIVNRPEVAVLGIGRGILKPVVKGGKIQTATMLPLALSYDHRVIDGADAARFIKELVEGFEQIKESDLGFQKLAHSKKPEPKKRGRK